MTLNKPLAETSVTAINTLGYVILELLERKPLSGYDVKKRFVSSMSLGWYAHDSQIYPMLRQLEQKGLVTSRKEASSSGPDRRIYSITATGHEELLCWLASPFDDTRQKSELMMRVWAADLMSAERFEHLLAEVEAQTNERLHQLTALRDTWQQRFGPPESAADERVVGSLLCLEHDIQLARAKLLWLERAKNVIRVRTTFKARGAASKELVDNAVTFDALL